MCQALWGNQNVGWEFLPSINSAGGLLCVWNEQVFKTVRRERGRGYILLEGVWTMKNQKTYIVNIYSPCDNRHKRELWESLKQLRQQDPEGLWCFLGDFNSIRHHSEREGVSHRGRQANSINEFNEWIADIEFEEIPSVGRQLTWFKPNETTKSKLDRFLVSLNWLLKWPSCTSVTLDRNFSNHCPILLGAKSFFFFFAQQK